MIAKGILVLACLLPLSVSANESQWRDYDHLYLQGGTYAHFTQDDDHDGPNIFVSLEAVRSDNWLAGLGLFDNSFGEFSQYLYVGKNWHFKDKLDGFHAKLTVGIIHGYEGDYKDKIPFNKLGIAPGVIPGIGYKKNKLGFDMILLGNSAMLFTVGYEI